jgi:hypothetical protein
MSLFQKCEVYLNKYNIELDDNDYTPDGRILVDSNDEIRKWDGFLDVPSRRDKKIDELLK